MWIIWLVVLVGIVLLVVLAVRAFGGGARPGVNASGGVTGGPPARSRARDVLDERYARGELTTEEYRERLTALGEDAAG